MAHYMVNLSPYVPPPSPSPSPSPSSSSPSPSPSPVKAPPSDRTIVTDYVELPETGTRLERHWDGTLHQPLTRPVPDVLKHMINNVLTMTTPYDDCREIWDSDPGVYVKIDKWWLSHAALGQDDFQRALYYPESALKKDIARHNLTNFGMVITYLSNTLEFDLARAKALRDLIRWFFVTDVIVPDQPPYDSKALARTKSYKLIGELQSKMPFVIKKTMADVDSKNTTPLVFSNAGLQYLNDDIVNSCLALIIRDKFKLGPEIGFIHSLIMYGLAFSKHKLSKYFGTKKSGTPRAVGTGPFERIVSIANINKNHWITFCIENRSRDERAIYMCDSMGGSPDLLAISPYVQALRDIAVKRLKWTEEEAMKPVRNNEYAFQRMNTCGYHAMFQCIVYALGIHLGLSPGYYGVDLPFEVANRASLTVMQTLLDAPVR